MTKDELREQLAALEHDRWCRFEQDRENALYSDQDGLEEYWSSKRGLVYGELTNQDKDACRAEADRTLEIVWPLIQECIKPRCPECNSVLFFDIHILCCSSPGCTWSVAYPGRIEEAPE